MKWVLIIMLSGDTWSLSLDPTYSRWDECQNEAAEWQQFSLTVSAVCVPVMSEIHRQSPTKRRKRGDR